MEKKASYKRVYNTLAAGDAGPKKDDDSDEEIAILGYDDIIPVDRREATKNRHDLLMDIY